MLRAELVDLASFVDMSLPWTLPGDLRKGAVLLDKFLSIEAASVIWLHT